MNEVEQRLRRDLAAAVQGVEAPEGLAAAAVAGGRRRVRRQRAFVLAPVAAAVVVVATGGVVTRAGWPDGSGDVTPAPAASRAVEQPPAPPTREERAAAVVAATEASARAALAGQREEAARYWAAEGQADLAAFYGGGYDTDEAQQFAALWNVDLGEAKARAGADLRAGRLLPVAPSDTVSHESPGWEVEAFDVAGYTAADAEQLARTWGVDEWQAQVEGGRSLLAGDVLPVAPSGTPAPGVPDEATGPAPEAS